LAGLGAVFPPFLGTVGWAGAGGAGVSGAAGAAGWLGAVSVVSGSPCPLFGKPLKTNAPARTVANTGKAMRLNTQDLQAHRMATPKKLPQDIKSRDNIKMSFQKNK
jgi:hypothetical protein